MQIAKGDKDAFRFMWVFWNFTHLYDDLVDAAREVKDKGTFGYLDRAMSTPELNAFMQA